MAHVVSVKIDGLLGRTQPIELDFERDVNVIFGDNGCGKTTLLKIIDAALSRDPEAIHRLPVERAEVYIFSINENKTIKHVWERRKKKKSDIDLDKFILTESNDITEYERRHFFMHSHEVNDWKLTPTPRRQTEVKRWAHTFLPTTRLYLGEKMNRPTPTKSQLSESQFDEVFSETVNRTWLIYYSNTLQTVRKIQEEGFKTILDNVLSPNSDETATPKMSVDEIYSRVGNFLSRQSSSGIMRLGDLESFKSRYLKDKNLRRAVTNLYDVERRIEEAMKPIASFISTIEKLFSNNKKITASANQIQVQLSSGDLVSAASLSSGEKHLLKILLAAMTSERNAVLIDEPELSMHIDWQRALVQTVHSLNPDCQLILASHSPEIMADLSDKNIFKI